MLEIDDIRLFVVFLANSMAYISLPSGSGSARATRSPEATALALRISHSNSLRPLISEEKKSRDKRPSIVPAVRPRLLSSIRRNATKLAGLNHTAMRQASQTATAAKK